jgi:Ser/Thr protein kinase RdoA (MazF antagonist)
MLEVVVKHYIQMPLAEKSAVIQLPKQTIYNDWHGWNMLQNGQRISGIIDFDSIVEAPRIVDVQNVLSYILISKNEPSRELVAAFLRQYKLSCPLEAGETLLIQTVMIDRMLHIISEIQRESPCDGTRVELAGRMVRFLHWIVRAEKLPRWLEDEVVPI